MPSEGELFDYLFGTEKVYFLAEKTKEVVHWYPAHDQSAHEAPRIPEQVGRIHSKRRIKQARNTENERMRRRVRRCIYCKCTGAQRQ